MIRNEPGSGRLWLVPGRPHPFPIRPEPEQGAQAGAHEERCRVPDSTFQAHQILHDPDAAVVDEQADAVEEEEQDTFSRRALALAVPECPVAIANECEDRRCDSRDRDRNVLAETVQCDRASDGDHGADPADDQKPESFVEHQAHPLVQPVDADHWLVAPSCCCREIGLRTKQRVSSQTWSHGLDDRAADNRTDGNALWHLGVICPYSQVRRSRSERHQRS